MQSICVFCGSGRGGDLIYEESARRLGHLLAERGIGLVFGAGHIGLMGVVADAVLEKGGTAVGMIPQALVDKELAHSGLTELHVVETMHQRKALMAERAEAFIALPGGLGTCDELFEILTWRQLQIHTKPIGILNIGGYFDDLLNWINHAIGEDFIRPSHRELFIVDQEAGSLLDRLAGKS